ncbi:cytokinin dehydrogenase 6-like [Canna indica]|uniref:cytokinin dehydrogenase n=1 Tax=Canna indica TaxID=4628 RepID=A0AAQ3QB43_9LILI|nr:cytokinin dehydrogenase 6-like [Canna indica]
MRTSSISSSSSLSVVVVVVVFLVGSLLSIVGQHKAPGHAAAVSLQLQSLQMNSTISVDPESLDRASTDFGMLARAVPAAVLRPSSDRDIAALVEFSYSSARPFSVAARGHGHSVRGQALAADGVVVEMASLRGGGGGGERIRVCRELGYVDAGGEELWIDVLEETMKHGLAPRSWTDYLYLTVGGTLSNAGLSGQSFLYGPQISNVYQLDVVTGTGQIVTCSEKQEPDLFFAVLGGLGQFGIITRARIAIEPAPAMVVRWIRLIYADFRAFTSDQERLISLEEKEKMKGFNYVEGSVIMASNLTYNWRSSFYAQEDTSRISGLAAQYGAVYCLEAAMYYDYSTAPSINQEVELLLKDLNFIPGFQFKNDVTYMHFLNRVREGELKLHSRGLWDVPHPWLNILVPSSRILDFDQGVFKTILKQNNNSVGPILIYATNRSKWDQRMSAVVPDEQVFYSVGLLRSGTVDDWKYLEEQNKEILRFCDEAAMSYKQYLPHYTNKADWMKHFGHKWDLFVERKMRYDPKALLSPGQRIFVSSFAQRASM